MASMIGPAGSLIPTMGERWQLFSKAGYSGWFSFLMVLPLINLIALYVLAFSDWPALRTKHTTIT